MQNSPEADEENVSIQADKLHELTLEWAVYFSLLARLFGQTAIGFHTVAKFPIIDKEVMSKAYQLMRSVDRDCAAFRTGMAGIGPDLDDIMRQLGENASSKAKKSAES